MFLRRISLRLLYRRTITHKKLLSVRAQQEEVAAVSFFENCHEISVLTLTRSKQKNALSRDSVSSINDAINNVANSNARVLVIRSGVPGVFCAGADLKERINMSQNEVSQFTKDLRSLMTKVSLLKMPVIAAIDGLALGGGLELALACDIRVATTTVKLGLVETKLAIIPGAGGTIRLPRLINPAIAKELIYTARVINGAKAKDFGLVNHAVKQNENGNAAFLLSIDIAKEIIPNGPIAIQMAKEVLNRGFEVAIDAGMALEEASYARVIPTKDRLEGLKAFIEKRPPRYIGE